MRRLGKHYLSYLCGHVWFTSEPPLTLMLPVMACVFGRVQTPVSLRETQGHDTH